MDMINDKNEAETLINELSEMILLYINKAKVTGNKQYK